MKPETVSALLELNRRFYESFGPAFAATRRRIQDGVRQVLARLPDEGAWLDVGCGSGSLAVEWLRAGRASRYLGLDFSASLLTEAQRAVSEMIDLPGAVVHQPAAITFAQADLLDSGWPRLAALRAPFRGALAFAVFHHLPGAENRLRVLRDLHALLQPGGWLVHSQWQFQHSPRLITRTLPWPTAGLDPADLEPGDTLLDWRFALPGQPEQTGLRYVHLFSHDELNDLAAQAGFQVLETFESDGHGGRLGLYQLWRKSD